MVKKKADEAFYCSSWWCCRKNYFLRNRDRIYRLYPPFESRFFAKLEDCRTLCHCSKIWRAHACTHSWSVPTWQWNTNRSRTANSISLELLTTISNTFTIGDFHRHQFLRIYEYEGIYRRRRVVAGKRLAAYCRIVYADFNRKSYFPIGFHSTGRMNGRIEWSAGRSAVCYTQLLNWLKRSSFQS